jgi:hypothetical protein
MRSLAFIGLILSVGAIADSSQNIVKSISIQNLTETSSIVWVNGVQKEIDYESGILVPCLPNENVEVQVNENIQNISCGNSLEIK